MKKLLLFITLCLFITKLLVSSYGCATIVPPPGGPKDTLPPVLLTATPLDSTLQFDRKRIEFSFDEYVEVSNPNQEVMVSPLTKNPPTVDHKLKTVTVKFSNQDTLDVNTTYTIHFGNAIKDLNEGNPLKDFTYTFSTGSYFDSLELSGKVILAENGKTDSTLIVMLHTSGEDSAIVNERPKYVTRLNAEGRFQFKNLPLRSYYVYALKDEGSYRYMKEEQLFAFANQPFTAGSPDSIILYAYKREEEKPKTTPPPASGNRRRNQDTETPRLKLSSNLVANKQDLLTNLVLQFEEPLRHYDSTLIQFYTDSTYTPVADYTLTKDSTNKKITLAHTWKEDTQYHLVIDKEFADDSSGRKLLLNDTLSFTTKKISEYATVKINFSDIDMNTNPVLLFIQNDRVTNSFVLTSPTLSIPMFPAGEYNLRIIQDRNQNGQWDPGDFFNGKIQPELIIPIEKKINLRANWTNDLDINL